MPPVFPGWLWDNSVPSEAQFRVMTEFPEGQLQRTPVNHVAAAEALPSDASPLATLVLNLGRALLHLGSPAHRLETAMEVMAARLGLTAQFFSTPTALFAALGDGAHQQTFLVRVQPGSADLGKLADLTDVMDDLAAGRITPEAADVRVRAIDERTHKLDGFWRILGTILIGCGGAGLLGGGVLEILLGGGLGLATGLLATLLGRGYTAAQLVAPVCATLVTLLAMLTGAYTDAALMPAIIGGVISLLPGMTLTTATRELATGHLVSGSSRLASAILTFVLLAFGLSIGSYLGAFLVTDIPVWYPSAQPLWLLPGAVLLAACGFTLLYRAHWRDWIWILLGCGLAYAGAELGRWVQGAYLAPFLGGFAVGLAGNLYARLSFRPASTVNLPALVLLVPGSLGLSSLAILLDADIVAGVETAFQAIMTAVALTIGMIVAGVVVPPKQEL